MFVLLTILFMTAALRCSQTLVDLPLASGQQDGFFGSMQKLTLMSGKAICEGKPIAVVNVGIFDGQ
jgi:hypothetical protein